MENYIGLIIAVEDYHDPKNLRKVKFALKDATGFKASLVNLGCDDSKLEYLLNDHATKTTISEKLKNIAKYATPTETIILYYAGHGFFHNGKNLISCVDTSLISLAETTIDINSILASLDESKSNRVIVFLDCCHSGIEFSEAERTPVSDFSTDSLKHEYRNAEHLTVFASCKSDEKSQADIKREHGVWSYYLIQALSGEAEDIYDSGILFSDKLQKYLTENTYRRVKKITTSKKNQTPIKFGKETAEKFIVADLSRLLKEKEIEASADGIKFESATILVTNEDWVRNLPGFEANHKEPKVIDGYHEEWIQKIATKLLEDELNNVADSLRKKLKYKRNDIEEVVIEDGYGQLSTVDFDYVVGITQSKESPNQFILTRQIENFRNGNVLNNDGFNEVFKNTFDELKFALSEQLSIKNVIDRIEKIDNEEEISVHYDITDETSCTIKAKGIDGIIVLTENEFSIQVYRSLSPKDLVLSCQDAHQALEQQGVPKMLA